MGKKVKITFLGDAESLDYKGKIEMSAKRGDVKELHQASADHWINRGKAIEGEVKLDDSKINVKSEALEKAESDLQKANERLEAAKKTPLTAKGAEKELDLATKYQEKKQQEYDELTGTSDKS